MRHGRYDEAIAQYREALTGLYEHDPNLMLGLAQAQFGKGDAAGARTTLDELIRLNPDFRSPRRTSAVRTRARSGGQRTESARGVPRARASYPGAEAAVRYAQLLQAQGRARRGAERRA